jgi:hypothetical protein
VLVGQTARSRTHLILIILLCINSSWWLLLFAGSCLAASSTFLWHRFGFAAAAGVCCCQLVGCCRVVDAFGSIMLSWTICSPAASGWMLGGSEMGAPGRASVIYCSVSGALDAAVVGEHGAISMSHQYCGALGLLICLSEGHEAQAGAFLLMIQRR